MSWLLVGGVCFILLLVMRWAIHHSLAPDRVDEARTPADIDLLYQEVSISSERVTQASLMSLQFSRMLAVLIMVS